jgi:hypothetical protein
MFWANESAEQVACPAATRAAIQAMDRTKSIDFIFAPHQLPGIEWSGEI